MVDYKLVEMEDNCFEKTGIKIVSIFDLYYRHCLAFQQLNGIGRHRATSETYARLIHSNLSSAYAKENIYLNQNLT